MPQTIATTLSVRLAALGVALAAKVGARLIQMGIVQIVIMVLMVLLHAICEELNALVATDCLVRHAGARSHCQHLGTTDLRGNQSTGMSLQFEKRPKMIAEQTSRRASLVALGAVPIAVVGARITRMMIIA